MSDTNPQYTSMRCWSRCFDCRQETLMPSAANIRSRPRPSWSCIWTAARRNVRAFLGDQGGASIIVIGLTLPALIGSMGLAVEISYWHLHKRAMQNAADAAAIAAATSNGSAYGLQGGAGAAP